MFPRTCIHVLLRCTNVSLEPAILFSTLKMENRGLFIIIIIIFINCNWVITRWQWLFYMYKNMEKKVTREFNSGGLHEKHVVGTWKLGNHLSIRL